jgi:hypothetical protein
MAAAASGHPQIFSSTPMDEIPGATSAARETLKDGASIINTAHKSQRNSACKLRASALAQACWLL